MTIMSYIPIVGNVMSSELRSMKKIDQKNEEICRRPIQPKWVPPCWFSVRLLGL